MYMFEITNRLMYDSIYIACQLHCWLNNERFNSELSILLNRITVNFMKTFVLSPFINNQTHISVILLAGHFIF